MWELITNPLVYTPVLLVLAFFSYKQRKTLPFITARWRGETVSDAPQQSVLVSLKEYIFGDGKPVFETYDAKALLGPIAHFTLGWDPCATARVTQPLRF